MATKVMGALPSGLRGRALRGTETPCSLQALQTVVRLTWNSSATSSMSEPFFFIDFAISCRCCRRSSCVVIFSPRSASCYGLAKRLVASLFCGYACHRFYFCSLDPFRQCGNYNRFRGCCCLAAVDLPEAVGPPVARLRKQKATGRVIAWPVA